MANRHQLNSIRTFDAVARRMSFSLAAEELSISQSAVSQQVRQLEADLGSELFIRHNRSISLTESGRAYFGVVREVLDRLDAVTQQLFPKKSARTLTVRCTPSVAALWLSRKLRNLGQIMPDVDVRIITLENSLDGRHRAWDIEIFRGRFPEDTDADTEKLWDAEILPVCAPAYLASVGCVHLPQDLARCDLIHTLGYKNDWHRWFRTFAPSSAKAPTGLAVDGMLIAIDAAENGDGILLGRRPLVDPYLADGRLVRVFQANYSLQSTYLIRVNHKSASWRAALRLRDLLQAKPLAADSAGRTEGAQ
ncbi:LysR family transcriptional regulator [Pseudorhodobacter sp.]|uniref:LysR family transcriptional regulator n=1 Tax=Pseudorhodobacter sp. TaxID=1934400 RepID=UPI002AFF902D|nr:LysR family transcriptional regulator [Pseudorhodobacter sp.]